MPYSVDTAIQRYSYDKWKVSIYADGLWRISHHRSLEEARNAVHNILFEFNGKIGK
jgi:hypothetical protein